MSFSIFYEIDHDHKTYQIQRQWMAKSLSMRYSIFTILTFLIPNKDLSTRSALVFLSLKGAFEPSLGMVMMFAIFIMIYIE